MHSEKNGSVDNNAVPVQLVNYKNASMQRVGVIVGIICVVSVIVYFTPMPEEYFESCERPCHELDWPMICRVKLTLEVYKSLSRACKDCPSNSSDCGRPHCVSADGHARALLAANRRLPGPSVQVCENDIMVIDVVNRVPGQGVVFHWRGQPQRETPFMDGVPMVTQCPIPAYTTFQYKFRASAAGTHLYHAHSGAEAADGLYGALVVRKPDKLEPQIKLYDYDLNDHVMVISEWSHGFAIQNILDIKPLEVESLLINGKGLPKEGTKSDSSQDAPLSVFKVSSGKRYRFRVAYAGGVKGCPITFSVDGHNMLLIALDGSAVVPKNISSMILGRGERADFVLTANRNVDFYTIQVSTVENCAKPIYSAAVLKYDGAVDKPTAENAVAAEESDRVDANDSHYVVDSELNMVAGVKCGEERTVCLNEVKSLEKIPEALRGNETKTTIFLPFQFNTPEQFPHLGASHMDRVTFTFPPSPLLTQASDVPAAAMCTRAECAEDQRECECVHVRKIPEGDTVEIILVEQGGDSDHVFHLHGYSFYVVANRQLNSSMDPSTILKMHEEGTLFLKKNLEDPVLKDTVAIPRYGAVALRFVADNPGLWMLRDEAAGQWTRGLDVLLQVGDPATFVRPPPDFPKCGSFVWWKALHQALD